MQGHGHDGGTTSCGIIKLGVLEFSDGEFRVLIRVVIFDESAAEVAAPNLLSVRRLLNPFFCNASTTSSTCMLRLTKFAAGI
jgi:hypothetical protein